MRHAKLDKSPRLQRLAAVLRSHRKPLSTMELITKSNVAAISAAISELRENGMDIKCWRSGDVWWYQEVKP